MSVHEVPEFLGLEAATPVADPVCAGGQAAFLPRRADVIVFEEDRIPKMKIHRESVDLDVEKQGSGEIFVQLQGLKPLALVDVGRWHLLPFAGVGEGGLGSRQMDDRTKIDPGTDVVEHPRGKIGILLRVVYQQGNLG